VKQARIHATIKSFRYLRRGDGQTLGQIFGLQSQPILNGEFEKKRNFLTPHGHIVSPISNLEIGNAAAQIWLSSIDRYRLQTTHERSVENRAKHMRRAGFCIDNLRFDQSLEVLLAPT